MVTDRQPSPMTPEIFVIHSIEQNTSDVFTWGLRPRDTSSCAFLPGQFNMLYLFGKGEVPISISGGTETEIHHTIRATGVVTKAMQAMQVGEQVGLRGPYGRPWPIEEAEGKDVLLIAGGIGFAPLRPVVHAIISNREAFGHVTILYGAREPASLLFQEECVLWREQHDIHVDVTVDMGLDGWRGHVGVVTTRIPSVTFDPARVCVMMCGPEIMMRFCAEALLSLNVHAQDIYVSMERNMKCAVGWCGHCQLGPTFICKDGPVYRFPEIQPFFLQRER
ncbi:MAG TPA: Ni/Fe hydrogenase subunit gamma [Myxococcales bacterium]|nr:Ni/Fe hydrogenase subunit gamma [Deltaproteobacteria bacterium]HAA58057.1 Ni/Fe hydrogenase subunit gamma [Myxococcales bacterium]